MNARTPSFYSKRRHDRQAPNVCIRRNLFAKALVIGLIPLLAAGQEPPCEQKIAECRQKADAAIAALQKRLENLESQSDDPRFQGSGRILYTRQVQELRDQLRAEAQLKAGPRLGSVGRQWAPARPPVAVPD
jgi:hypothetical protein